MMWTRCCPRNVNRNRADRPARVRALTALLLARFWRALLARTRTDAIRPRQPAGRCRYLQMDRTDYRYNHEYRATVRAQMLALASGLIAGDLDLIAVARKLNVFCDGVEPEI